MAIKITKGGEYQIKLIKRGQNESAEGRFLVKKGENLVLVTNILHEARQTTGKVHIKAVVEEGGSLDLRGKIIITKKGGGADGFLKFEVLKLGKNSKVVVIPDLEIATNEVKASHAASVGGIPAEELNYLQSRGFDKQVATQMIVEGFLELS